MVSRVNRDCPVVDSDVTIIVNGARYSVADNPRRIISVTNNLFNINRERHRVTFTFNGAKASVRMNLNDVDAWRAAFESMVLHLIIDAVPEQRQLTRWIAGVELAYRMAEGI